MSQFLTRLDAAVAEYSLLKHPFYQAWSAGMLTRETLQEYAKQYYHFERAFPSMISQVHANTSDLSHRKQLLLNLMEEEGGDVNHPELWLRFADALDVNRADVLTQEMYPETKALVDCLREATRNGDTLEGTAALYGYESQIPEIATAKIDGLKRFYGVASEQGLSFFVVHEEADEIHRQAERDMMLELVKSAEDEERAIRAAQLTAKAFYQMLDGIVRECNVECEMK
jgi:pyrroloquinoline-quinone synthase